MASRKCCVPYCDQSGLTSPILHHFPNPTLDFERFKTWVSRVYGDTDQLDIFKVMRVCHRHFEDRFISKPNRLVKTAVPTLYLKGHELWSRVPLQSLSNSPTFAKRLRIEENIPKDTPLVETASISMPDILIPSTSKHHAFKPSTKISKGARTEENIPKDSPLVETASVLIHDTLIPSTSKRALKPSTKMSKGARTEENIPKDSPLVETASVLIHDTLIPSTSKRALKPSTKMSKGARTEENIPKDSPLVETASVLIHDTLIPSTSKRALKPSTKMSKGKKQKTGLNNDELKLKKLLLSARNKLKRCKDSKARFLAQLKEANKLLKTRTIRVFANSDKLSKAAQVLINLLFRELRKKEKGRRFSVEEKVIALALYKRGPKCYRFLRKIFILPSPLSLSRLLNTASIKAGANEQIFSVLKQKVMSMKADSHKVCILLWDEMALQPNFQYNPKKDRITGFVNNGVKTEKKIADHALVFMIRGVMKNYKQPILFTFCSGTTKATELQILIKNTIEKLFSIGLIVVGTVCDQGATNQSAINSLINKTKADYLRKGNTFLQQIFEVNGYEIIPIYDPPHLIKGIRNNFITKNIKFTIDDRVCVAKWNHLEKLHEENPGYKGIRLIPKLSDQHIKANCIPKMKVKYATELFSRTVSINMGFLASKNPHIIKRLLYGCK